VSAETPLIPNDLDEWNSKYVVSSPFNRKNAERLAQITHNADSARKFEFTILRDIRRVPPKRVEVRR
jgi:hypothetical protein